MFTTLRFVDRDMMMRFIGGAVGHKGARPENGTAWTSYDVLDKNDIEEEEGADWEAESVGDDDELIHLQTTASLIDALDGEEAAATASNDKNAAGEDISDMSDDDDDEVLGPEDGEDEQSFIEGAGYDDL
jgi:hypothetical protein